MKFLHPLLFLSILALLLPSVASADKYKNDLEQMREVYINATDGDKRKVRKAIKATNKFSHKYRRSPLGLMYKGAALSLRGMNNAKRPLDRMRETEEGLNTVDRALRIFNKWKGDELEKVEGRLVAGFLFVNLPDSVFHRLNEGAHIIKELLAHPKLEEMPRGLKAAIYLAASIKAEKYSDPEEQKLYLNKAIDTDPDGRNGKDAKERLKALG